MLNRNAFFAGVFVVFCSTQTRAQGYDALEVCRGQSGFPEDIVACLDNYLDLLDQNLGDLTIFIDGELRGGDRAAFNRAQNSFYNYRRENCLWYLALGTERVEAEQVAKNCLAKMSQDRLAELQGLIAEYQTGGTDIPLADNPFQEPVTDLTENNDAVAAAVEPTVSPSDAPNSEASSGNAADESNNAGVSAYLGQWQVTCADAAAFKRCTMDVSLEPVVGESNGSVLRVTRSSNEDPFVELQLPNNTIESPETVLWRVDDFTFGSIPGSTIISAQAGVRQIVNESKFVSEELLPQFQRGAEIGITLLKAPGGSDGEKFLATLAGFSRALTFVDEYISGKSQ